jgi:O-antigen/teichoic acid export membrane protein
LARSTKHAVAVSALTLLCRLDVFAAALVLPQALLGQYVVAASFGEFLAQVPAFAGFLLFAETPRDISGKRQRLLRIVYRAFVFASIAAAALLLMVPPLVRVLLGSQYDEASRLFIWLLPAYVLASVLRVAAGFLAAIGDTGLLVRISAAGALTMPVLMLAAGPAQMPPMQIALYAAAAEAVAVAVLVVSVSRGPQYE